jgi:hypothetical protein
MGASNRGHQTQWAAQFAVASELCKRGYEVAFTMGHATPIADLMVVSPVKKTMFLVDVKGLYRKNPWVVGLKEPRDNLYYVLAFVPVGRANEYFVLSQEDANALIGNELKRLGRASDYPVTGFLFGLAKPFREMWERLPQ